MWWTFLLRGGFAVLLGLYALFNPSASLSLLALALGVFCLADGTAGFIGALLNSERREFLLQSLVSVAIGAVLIFWPGESLRALLIVFGLWLLVTGVTQVVSARRLDAADPNRGLLNTLGLVAGGAGLLLLLWPGTGLVAAGWIIGLVALLLGGVLIYLSLRFREASRRLQAPGNP
jgi:uncharacterized membrane protein HdeD (DUF308 family)